MGNLQIGAVIPAYNRGPLIGRAIDSVLCQSQPAAEVIVVDDGSTDDTARRVASFGRLVHYIRQDRAGSAAARNRGVQAAQSEWIAFLDSDDLWFETHLEHMARAIHGTAAVACFYFADAVIARSEGDNRLWEMCSFDISGPHQLASDAAEWVMMKRQPMLLQSSVFKRASYLETGGLWERLRYREDTHLFLKLGIGRPACAVGGCGVRMTDDDPKNRLSVAHEGNQYSGHWMRALVYQDLLSRPMVLEPAHRREMRARLAAAHRRLAHLAWNKRDLPLTVRHAVRGAALAPRRFIHDFHRMAIDSRA